MIFHGTGPDLVMIAHPGLPYLAASRGVEDLETARHRATPLLVLRSARLEDTRATLVLILLLPLLIALDYG